MSETQGRTLAETLRAWVEADAAYRRAGDDATAALVEVPTLYRHHDTAMAYLRGYDDARAECAAEIEENGALKRRVQELEAQRAERPQPAAVGVVGNISWAVVEGTLVTYRFGSRETAKNRAMRAGGRFVAIVDPDQIVQLTSKEPVAWRDSHHDGLHYSPKLPAYLDGATVTPLYAGTPEPARGEA